MFDEEVFEIQDFTTSSDWERFICSLEEIVRSWDLTNKPVDKNMVLKKGAFTHGNWRQQYETIKFSRVSFVLEHHYLEENSESVVSKREYVDEQQKDVISLPTACVDMMARDNDFPPRAHCLARWYGLREFLVLTPAANNDSITLEDKSKLLVSSACIALHDTNCCVPFFVQLLQRKDKLFSGVCQSSDGMRTHFDMIRFRDFPGPYRYLSELINLFRDKLASPLVENQVSSISVRLTFRLTDWPNGWFYGRLHDFVPANDEEEDDDEMGQTAGQNEPSVENYNELSSGCTQEPILELQLATTWPLLSEEVIVDSAVHTDLDPIQAPIWSLKAIFKDALTCSLSDSIHLLEALKNSRHANEQILGKFYVDVQAEEEQIEFKNALLKLTNPNPLSVQLPSFNPLMKWNRPKWIKENCMAFIFDRKEDKDNDKKAIIENNDELHSLKSAPVDSLTWRIAMTLCNVHYRYKELADLAHLWKEIICELRNCWENGYSLPKMKSSGSASVSEPSSPNMGMCLFHQKLQMLNCCIEAKRKREMNKLKIGGKENAAQLEPPLAKEDSDDEFYDCPEELQMNASEQMINVTPEGRESQCGHLTLLNDPNEPLYIPITQDCPPQTEDMMLENHRILSQLGTSAESAALRAKMQCATLLSDMQAFKAANPGAQLGDFIRWHSPRDWIEAEEGSVKGGEKKKGQLSVRMQGPGNLWQDIWQTAMPIPAHKQKRLFDDTKEAEKVLHHFSSMSISELVNMLMPIVIKSGIMQLVKMRKEMSLLDDELPLPCNVMIIHTNDDNFDAAINLMKENERKLYQLQSLVKKLEIAHDLELGVEKEKNNDEMRKFALKMMSQLEVDVPKAAFGYYGKIISRMFSESQTAFYEENTSVGERVAEEKRDVNEMSLPPPFGKEFIFRVSIPRPFEYSRNLPQRMYCSLMKHEFRICGAFSEDTTYF